MDNAIDALKIAFAVLIFVIALSVTMNAFSQAKTVSDYVFYMADKTNFYEYISENRNADYRVVSGETIIPTLYRYYKENFNVIIKDANDKVLVEFNLEDEIKAYNKDYKSAPWLGNANIDTKLRVDVEVSGKEKTINGVEWKPKVAGGILAYVKGKKFEETFREYRYSGKEITVVKDEKTGKEKIDYVDNVNEDTNEYTQVYDRSEETLELVKGNTKIEIIYKEIPTV
ncbi:MAG: hypothetical protein IJ223_02100 [Clostridia bacterium]|nr:hypothetical protein [Clostridia bacterium]